jgi:putative ABC transport system permease protein
MSVLRSIGIVLRTMRRRAPVRSVVVALSIGICVTGAVLAGAALYALLWKPLPFPEPERLITVAVRAGGEDLGLTAAEALRIADAGGVFAASGGVRRAAPALFSSPSDVRPLEIARVTPSLFAALGMRAEAGRVFLESDGAGDRLVLLPTHTARALFPGPDAAVGQVIELDRIPHTVVGVVSGALRIVAPADAWLVLDLSSGAGGPRAIDVVARVGRGVPIGVARAHAEQIVREERTTDAEVRVVPLRRGSERLARQMRALALLTACLLAVVLANVVSLQLLRGRESVRDTRVRAALGASPYQLAQPQVIECLVLGAGGSGAGLIAAAWLADGASALLARSASFEAIDLSLPVAGAWVSISLLLSAVLFLVMRVAARPGPALVDAGSRTVPAAAYQQFLASGQIAFAVAATIGALAAVQLSLSLQRADPGFAIAGRWSADIKMASVAEQGDPQVQGRTLDGILARVRALPHVQMAGAISSLPLHGVPYTTGVSVDGAAEWLPEPAQIRFVTPGYFETMRIPRIDGETGWRGPMHAPVAVISERLARQLWPDQPAVGRYLAAAIVGMPTRVAGVVGDVRHQDLGTPAEPAIYLSTLQFGSVGDMTIVAAGEADAAAVPGLLRAVARQSPEPVHVGEVRTLDGIVSRSIEEERMLASFGATAALAGLLLAAIGVFTVSAQTVSARMTEFAVRLTCGATSRHLTIDVVRRAVASVAAGIVAGVMLASVLHATVVSRLFPEAASDPALAAYAVALVALVAFAATLPPAFAASRVDPAILIRRA